jgi:hypothetical protein
MDADILPISSMHGFRSETIAGDSCFLLSDRYSTCHFQGTSLPDEHVEWKRFRPTGSRRGPQTVFAERVLTSGHDAFVSLKESQWHRAIGTIFWFATDMRFIRKKNPRKRLQRTDSANVRIDNIPESLFI